jgi:hypothetical protein
MIEILETTLERVMSDSRFDVVRWASSDSLDTIGLDLQVSLMPPLTVTNAGTLWHVCILVDNYQVDDVQGCSPLAFAFAFTGRMDGIDYMHTIVNEVCAYILKCEM